MDRQQEFVLRTVEERDVRFIRLWFTDVLGMLKSVAIAPAELESAFAEGIGFDGSAIEGLTRVYEADMVARPDPTTFSLLPWRGETQGTARMFCDILNPDGTPSLADSRNVLKRSMDRASEQGFTFYTHPEVEFYLFETPTKGGPLIPIDHGGYFDHVARPAGHDFRRQVITMLESMSISVEFSHHEAGPGQNEIDLRYADALTTADNLMTFRTVVKEVALEQGVFASFMPKPLADQPGSGMHTHFSLFEGDRNAFHEPGAQYELSKTGRQFIAGLLHHAAEITAVTNQYVNSYKRLWGGSEAPHTCAGDTTTVQRSSASPCTNPENPTPHASNTGPSTPQQTPTLPTPSHWQQDSKESKRGTNSPMPPKTTSGTSPTPNAEQWESNHCPKTSTRPSTSWKAPNSSPKSLVSTCSTTS